uniref:Uncharacterized protein n=1 Tax=Arundo donax TaxID=35708 RepID=A0A0A9DPS4_ARUDO
MQGPTSRRADTERCSPSTSMFRCLLGAEAPPAGTGRPELERPGPAQRGPSSRPGPPWSWRPRRATWSAVRPPWRACDASRAAAAGGSGRGPRRAPWTCCGARRGRPGGAG